MKTSKKMLSLLLIAAMLVSVLCVGVSATEDYDPVSISEGEPVTISWNGTTGTVVSVDGSSYIPQEFLKINSTSTNLLFVNGTKVTGATPSNPYEINVTLAANESATYQIITQNGDKAPHIVVVKLTCNAN